MKNPYNETILADGKKGLLKLHLLQRRLNYMSNGDNFPSIHCFLWKVKNTDAEREITWTIYNLWNGHNRKKKKKDDCKKV